MPIESPVSEEANWLVERMNMAGLGNAGLHAFLQQNGWTGQANNVANWRSGASRIPGPMVPLIMAAAGFDPESGEGKNEVIKFFRNRYPFLAPYLQQIDEPNSPGTSRKKARQPMPVYYARNGAMQGKRFVPHRNRDGRFVAGTSRFEKDQVTFATLEELVEALGTDPDLKVRMVCEDDSSSPPSLIRQRSLAWE